MRFVIALAILTLPTFAHGQAFKEPKGVILTYNADKVSSKTGVLFRSYAVGISVFKTSGVGGSIDGPMISFLPRFPKVDQSLILEVDRPPSSVWLTCHLGGGRNLLSVWMVSGDTRHNFVPVIVTSPRGAAFQFMISRSQFAKTSEIYFATTDPSDEWTLKECVMSKKLEK